MTASERQWVAYLKACKSKGIYARELRDAIVSKLHLTGHEALTAADVGLLIRLVNDCDLRGKPASASILNAIGRNEAA